MHSETVDLGMTELAEHGGGSERNGKIVIHATSRTEKNGTELER